MSWADRMRRHCPGMSVCSFSMSIRSSFFLQPRSMWCGFPKVRAGIGPATAFLYSGPAINVLAIILTARILGMELGVARAVGAILFSIIIGLMMHLIFIREERTRAENPADPAAGDEEEENRPLWQNGLYFAAMAGILVFANWSGAAKDEGSLWAFLFKIKWPLTGLFLAALIAMLISWFKKDELKDWTASTWTFARQILPLLFLGVLVAGVLLGRPGHDARDLWNGGLGWRLCLCLCQALSWTHQLYPDMERAQHLSRVG